MNQLYCRYSVRQRSALLAVLGLGAFLAPVARAFPAVAHVAAVGAEVPVAGRITQANGEGIPGVTVLVKGTTIGTTSGADGSFALQVPENSTLIFSSIGFTAREIAVNGATSDLAVRLAEDQQALAEVVVVGYGTQERGSVTGAISSVSGRDLATQPVADPTQALQGRAAGVTVTQNSGAPGGAGGTAVRIRGITSAGNNSPLYVIDGFPLPSDASENQLNSINPNDIESIDVLKDASATAIYGLRAANGVVIITTKRGKAGTSNINLDAYRGVQQVWRQLDLLNAEQYATINNENHIAHGDAPLDRLRDTKALGTGSDWQKAVFRPTAVIQSYNLSASGGSEKARYAVSGGYFQQDGTLNGSDFERFTLRANGDVQLSKRVKFGNSLSLTHQSERQLDTGNSEFGVLNNVLQAPATLAVFNPDGSWHVPTAAADNYVEPNPVLQSLISNTRNTRNRVLSTLFGEVAPVKGLRFRTNIGVDLTFDNSRGFTPSLGANVPRYNVASGYASSNYNPGWLIENTLTYDKLLADKHQVTVLVGQSAQEFNYSNIYAGRTGYLSNDLQQINNGPIGATQGTGGTSSQARLASYFGRANYEFKGKYLVSATARYDGSSAFALGHKFGFFPGASVGWRLSEENFIKDVPAISNLKLRGGYGRVGNPLNAGTFAYLATINTGITYPFGATSASGTQTINQGAAPTRAQNLTLRWEDNVQANVGVDVGLFGNRLEAALDVYSRRSPNLINNVPAYLVTGTYEAVPTNSLVSHNRGLDFSLTSHNLVGDNGKLTWTTTAIFSTYTTRVDELGTGGTPFNGVTDRTGVPIVRYDQGQPFGEFYGYVADGLIQTQEELSALNAGAKAGSAKADYYQYGGTAPGDIKFKDLNGDGVVNAADRTYIGNPNPDFTYSLNNTVSYKGFDLNVFLQGSQGNQVYNLNRVYTEGGLYSNGNSSTRVLGRWTGPGTSNDVPRAVATDPNQNLRVSSYFLEDGSYMRIKTLTLGYSIPKALLQHVFVQNLRVYVTGQNLLTLTKYTGFDPELGAGGLDRGIYPQSRVFLAGINVGF